MKSIEIGNEIGELETLGIRNGFLVLVFDGEALHVADNTAK